MGVQPAAYTSTYNHAFCKIFSSSLGWHRALAQDVVDPGHAGLWILGLLCTHTLKYVLVDRWDCR